MKTQKILFVSLLVVLLCSMNVSTAFADGEAPPPMDWSDATNPDTGRVDMSGLQATPIQVDINTGSGGDSYTGGDGYNAVSETITAYNDPAKGGTFYVMNDTVAANAYQNPVIQGLINSSEGYLAASSALAASQAQAGIGSIYQNAAMAGSTASSGMSLTFVNTNTLQNTGTTYGFNTYANTGSVYTPQGSSYNAALANALANNSTSNNLYTNTGFGTNNPQTIYTNQWGLANTLDVARMNASAAINSIFGNTTAANATNTKISEYQKEHNYSSNNPSLGQQILKALNPANIASAFKNLATTKSLGGEGTVYNQNVSPGMFGNQFEAAMQQLALSNLNATGGTTIIFVPNGVRGLSAFGFPSPGGGTPPGGTTPPPFVWIPIVPPVPTCSYYAVIPGSIGAIARHTAPPHPVVIGQDDQKRGADLWWELTIGPTVEEWETAEVIGYSTQCNPLNPNDCVTYEEYGCVMHRNYYCEPIAEATATATLSAASTEWILNDLSNKYPGATLKNPGFGYSEPAVGACAGTTYVWTIEKEKVQVEDPGNWDLSILGRTRGTPVSGSRNFNVAGGRFPAFLIDTTIIR